VTVVGPNGAGKTTLIATLAGMRELEKGKLRRGHNVVVGYLSQHAEELGNQGSVLDVVQRATGLTPNKARALVGRFLFSGEDAEKPLRGLSGGERRRLSLAILVSSGANFLIIDEPTNHLDLESREALEDALRSFDGTVLLVSHDRALLDAVGTRTIAIEARKLESHLGGWADYVRDREQRKAAAAPAPSPKEKKEKPRSKPVVSKERTKRIASLERQVSDAEAALKKLEDELADPSAWASPTGSERSAERHAQAKGRIDELYEELLALSEE